MREQICLYEELSCNSQPSLQTQLYDGWILRFSNGYTNRANSVNMLYPSTIDVCTKIAVCEEIYFNHNLPCVFKVIDDNQEPIDCLLKERGYQVVTPTDFMIMDLVDQKFESRNCIISEHTDEDWLHAFFEMEHCTDIKTQSMTIKTLELRQNGTLYCRIVENGKSIACASAVIERGYMFLANVVVDETYRGRGYGRQLCESILAKAKQYGAHTTYLQVVHNNTNAVKLYERLGYKKIYSYWYRVKKKELA